MSKHTRYFSTKCQNTLGYENMQIKEKPDYSVGALPWASTCVSAIVTI